VAPGEFTGERVIPGQVDPDLWNEHLGRYHLVSRISRRKRVLDVACGTGYGAAVLSRTAALTLALDISAAAISYAREHYPAANLHFLRAGCERTPFRDASFDLVTAFEVIEHIRDSRALLEEARRLLAPGGQVVVSTPNRDYYRDARGVSGPNPYHVREFDHEEFRATLAEVFPHVVILAQNHGPAVVFQPLAGASGADLHLERAAVNPGESHFFVAFCALAPLTGAPAFVYLPSAANVLRERERHIGRLEEELAAKNRWLDDLHAEHQQLVELFRTQSADLEARNGWAEKLNTQLDESWARVDQLQKELAAEQAAAAETAAGYEAKLAALDRENVAKTEWALETERRLTGELDERARELAECVKLLDQAEKTVVERTQWAQRLEEDNDAVRHRLALHEISRWHKLGRSLGLGPAAPKT